MDKVYLVGVDTQNDRQFERSMAELAELANACEMEVVGNCVQHTQINKAIYVGPGKLEQIREEAEELQADLLLFNDSLTPSQLRNIQDDTGMAVMDRTTLILEIFASRAKSREAMLQVEVARLQYLLPRLVGLHEALSRQGGTSGSMSSRGSGEKKLELDRRRAQSRLTELSRELAEMETERRTQQKKRARSAIPRVALVGYTNAGKSTIMNSMVMRYLGDAEKTVMEKDMLFATLDTTVRSITPKENKTVLLSDTVGFIDKLPHGLVKAFRSTLSEAASADLLLHVVDFSDPDYKDHIAVTNETLEEIGAADIPVLMVYNKVDRMEGASYPRATESAVYMSAKEEDSITLLADEVLKRVYAGHEICHMCLPYARGDIFSYLKEQANVLSESYEADGISVTVECSQADKGRFAEFLV